MESEIVSSTNMTKTDPKSNKRMRVSCSPLSSIRSSSCRASDTVNTKKYVPYVGGKDAEGSSKTNKGLRHFSMKVCKKVEEKQHTSYNEVADELVKEFMVENEEDDNEDAISVAKGTQKACPASYDEKNIRRRVYDALNVLLAMDIVSKDKKEIHWKGLPSNSRSDLEMLQKERILTLQEVEKKRECLLDLLVQNVCFRNLVRRNKKKLVEDGIHITALSNRAHSKSIKHDQKQGWNHESSKTEDDKIPLPFIVVNTSSKAVIQCEMCPDRTDIMFNFNMPFEINDDNEILKRLGLNKTTLDDVRTMLPPDLLCYCEEHHMLDSIIFHPQHIYQFVDPEQNITLSPHSYRDIPVSHASLQQHPQQGLNVMSSGSHIYCQKSHQNHYQDQPASQFYEHQQNLDVVEFTNHYQLNPQQQSNRHVYPFHLTDGIATGSNITGSGFHPHTGFTPNFHQHSSSSGCSVKHDNAKGRYMTMK